MAYYTRPQGLKNNGKPKTLQVTDDGYLKIDMQDATVVAEFTPGSNVTLLDTNGTNEAVIDSSGALKTVEKTPLTGFATAANQGVHKSVNTIIDDATFSETVTGADIDFSEYKHAILTIKTGTATTSPTLTAKLQVKDSNGNYHDYATLSAVSTATTITPEEFYYLSASTVRVVCTYGGSGSFANVTVELTLMD